MNISKARFAALIAMSIVGMASSFMVLYTWYLLRRPLPICTAPASLVPSSGITINCAAVLSSPYSEVGGVPLDALAAAWFIINAALVTWYSVSSRASSILKAIMGWRFIGIAIVPYLIYIELAVVRAICVYCTIMHAAIIIDFILVTVLLGRSGKRKNAAELPRPRDRQV
ncbi:VKOR family protein [Thermocladium modestius]|uniref:VKOR family protein n=1 Tax=Thermocladium modestius TaxID=62609 RepID=A0A830GV88_9CREN|nr:vitamin K epoxide reductase family protein [Thermocladium modestius]GGP21446.1 VKOR family protein [Thermocladium modestius]